MYDRLDTKLIEQSIEFMEMSKFFDSLSIKEFVETAYRTCVPLDFYLQPASSTGLYHPPYELGIGGLVRHTKAAMIMAETLFPLYEFDIRSQDHIQAALALHDISKPSKLHPIEAKLILEPLRDTHEDELKEIIPLIESHMGQWNMYGKLPIPITEEQKFVHLCDYLASRKNISINMKLEEKR